MRSPRGIITSTLVAILTLAAAYEAAAASILANGGFESGFAGWTRVDQAGSDGTFALQSGTASPINGDPVPAPPGGVFAAMTDAQAPGSHVLYQDFVVPAGITAASLSFDVFIGNRAGVFASPATLDFSTPTLNQQARVDILSAAADPFSVAPADVLLNVFQTNPGDPAVFGYVTDTTDLLALLLANAGSTLRLRFAEVDNIFIFQMGVDNVSLDVTTAAAIPEPATTVLVGTGLLALARRPLDYARGRRRT